MRKFYSSSTAKSNKDHKTEMQAQGDLIEKAAEEQSESCSIPEILREPQLKKRALKKTIIEQSSLKQAALINAASKYATVIINLLLSAVLARILTPEDYGIVAVTTVFTNFFSIFADMGIGTAVIQNKELTEEDTDNIFSFTIKQGIALMLCFAVFSFPLSIFYGNSVYIPIGLLLAVSLFFSTVNMVPNALLMKDKRFISVGIRTIVAAIGSGLIAVGLAFVGFGYYTLVLQSLISGIVIFIWNYFSTEPKFKLKYSKDSLQKIRRFSSFQFGFSFINYFARNADNLLISKFMGEAALGFYDKAYKLMLYPVNYLTNVITPVMHPILSDYQDNKKVIYEKYMSVLRILSLMGIFITPFCFSTADEIILIMFGNQWEAAIPCFQFMALAIWSQMLLSSTGSVFQSTGRTDTMFKSSIVTSAMTVTAILLGLAEKSTVSIARNIAISYNLQFVFMYYLLIKKTLGFKLWTFLRTFLPDIVMLVIMTLIGTCFSEVVQIECLILSALAKFIVIGLVYTMYLLVSKKYRILLKLVRRN